MLSWLQMSFQQNTLLWFLISSVLGGLVGASVRFVFDTLLPQRLQQRREVMSIKRKYTTPIVLAADELRLRLENVINHIDVIERENWLSSNETSSYYYVSTIYVVGQFFGWSEILRRTVVYIDFASTDDTRRFERLLRAVERGFSSPNLLGPTTTGLPARLEDKWVHSLVLRAIGALMLTCRDGEYRTIDFASFHKYLTQPEGSEHKQWLNPVSEIFRDLRRTDVRFRRIVALHALLNAFVENTDPKHLRTRSLDYHWDLLSDAEKNRIRDLLA